MLKTPVPEGFTIAFCRGSRWTWKQIYKSDDDSHVTSRGGFIKRHGALEDLRAELERRRASKSAAGPGRVMLDAEKLQRVADESGEFEDKYGALVLVGPEAKKSTLPGSFVRSRTDSRRKGSPPDWQ